MRGQNCNTKFSPYVPDMQTSMIPWIFVLSVAILFLPCSSQCDVKGCFCYLGYVSCYNITSFPEKLPADLDDISFHDVSIDRIPTNSFHGLRQLRSIKVFESTIGTIEKFSFDDLQNLDAIIFDSVSIGEIQDHAFNNLRNFSTEIKFDTSSIRTIRSDAFTDIQNVQSLLFINVNISNIESHAFENIYNVENVRFHRCSITVMAPRSFHNFRNIGSFGFYTNKVDVLGCGNIDSVISNVEEQSKIVFYSNEVTCGCALAWVVNNPVMAPFLSYFNRCSMPGFHVNIQFSNLTLNILNCSGQDAICPADFTTSRTEVMSQIQSVVASKSMPDITSRVFTRLPSTVLPINSHQTAKTAITGSSMSLDPMTFEPNTSPLSSAPTKSHTIVLKQTSSKTPPTGRQTSTPLSGGTEASTKEIETSSLNSKEGSTFTTPATPVMAEHSTTPNTGDSTTVTWSLVTATLGVLFVVHLINN